MTKQLAEPSVMERHRSMRDFVRIVEACGLTEDRVGVDVVPAAAACTLSELELHLGTTLVHRAERRLSLTSDGQRLLERARLSRADSTQPKGRDTDAHGDLRGIVRLGAPAGFAVHQLAKHLPRFHALSPDIMVDIDTDFVDDAHDLTIFIGRSPPPGDGAAHRLVHTEVVMCASPDYLDTRGRPLHPRELVEHALLLPPDGPERQEQLSLWRETASGSHPAQEVWSFKPKAKTPLSSPNADLAYAGALAGLGLCSLPSYVIEDALLESGLERVLPEWSLPGLTVWLCVPTRRPMAPPTKVLMDFLIAMFGASHGDPWLKFASCETQREG